MLKTELTAFLDYDKYDRIGFNSGNSRNGAYSRTLHTEYGDLEVTIPRDRNGEFKQQTVAPYKRSNDTLESFVIHMYQKGVTMIQPYVERKISFRAWAHVEWATMEEPLHLIKDLEIIVDEAVNLLSFPLICAYEGKKMPDFLQTSLMETHPYILLDDDFIASEKYKSKV